MEIVNGYVCRTCSDVDLAKKRIVPAHPKDGPDGVNAPGKEKDKAGVKRLDEDAVVFGGSLAQAREASETRSSWAEQRRDEDRPRTGSRVDLYA